MHQYQPHTIHRPSATSISRVGKGTDQQGDVIMFIRIGHYEGNLERHRHSLAAADVFLSARTSTHG
jgi:hypothetical protein